jgi:SAM-dependent methyltransferase
MPSPDARAPTHWFEPMAAHMGAAYLRYSFTKGTDQEVGFLVDSLGLRAGQRVLDVGCGPGRHAHALARRGLCVLGVDIAGAFVALARRDAPPGAAFVRGDARRLPVAAASVDVTLSLCQGGFGLLGDEDAAVLGEMARALRPGGRLVASAFSSYFAVRFLEEADEFDAATGVQHERAVLRSEDGEEAEFDAWTSCFTPRELRLLVAAAGLRLDALWSVTPGSYAARPPDLDHPEYLVVATRL